MNRLGYLGFVVAVPAILAAVLQVEGTPPVAGAAVQGKWVLVSQLSDGKPQLQSGSPMQVSFVGNQCVFGKTTGSYALRVGRNAKEIDLTFPGKDGKPYTLPGIYEVQGDSLTLCVPGTNWNRPSDLRPTVGDGQRFYRFKRTRDMGSDVAENNRDVPGHLACRRRGLQLFMPEVTEQFETPARVELRQGSKPPLVGFRGTPALGSNPGRSFMQGSKAPLAGFSGLGQTFVVNVFTVNNTGIPAQTGTFVRVASWDYLGVISTPLGDFPNLGNPASGEIGPWDGQVSPSGSVTFNWSNITRPQVVRAYLIAGAGGPQTQYWNTRSPAGGRFEGTAWNCPDSAITTLNPTGLTTISLVGTVGGINVIP